jgi:hypothetical protein
MVQMEILVMQYTHTQISATTNLANKMSLEQYNRCSKNKCNKFIQT